jgi:branched-chain amino acid aminotransferase
LHKFINFNGNLINPETPVATAFNRSLRYGDGLFETMYWDGEQLKFENYHFDRLFQGLDILQFDLSEGFERKFLSAEIRKLCLFNAKSQRARVRLNVFRQDSLFLNTTNNKPVFIIETADLPELDFQPIKISLFKSEKKSTGILSNLKTNNYLLNIVALQYASNNGFDDVLILNSRNNCCETSSSNIFMISDGIIFTPALSEGCVAGTKRRYLLEKLPALGFTVNETTVSLEALKTMDEIFLTNAIRQIRPVSRIDNRNYSISLTEKIIKILADE